MRSLRSRFLVASVLWTAGLLLLMHLFSLLVLHLFPRFRGRHSYIAVFVALLLMAWGGLVARRGFTHFKQLHAQLAAIRSGRTRQVDGVFPSEVQPLIDELNGLLEDREKAVQRAFAAAGDLAHGLKTPLAVLAQMDGGTEVVEQVDRMARQVNYHLARTRAAASGAAGASPCAVAPCSGALVRTLSKLHASRGLSITAVVAPDLLVRVQREDLDEVLGNLLDNACKWARSSVVLQAAKDGDSVGLTVDDDGPGLAAESRMVVLNRGVRMDEGTPGSGLGLAIVRDLAELYGGAVSLIDSPLGGLRARIVLPGG